LFGNSPLFLVSHAQGDIETADRTQADELLEKPERKIQIGLAEMLKGNI
jgi:hypothetical protein